MKVRSPVKKQEKTKSASYVYVQHLNIQALGVYYEKEQVQVVYLYAPVIPKLLKTSLPVLLTLELDKLTASITYLPAVCSPA